MNTSIVNAYIVYHKTSAKQAKIKYVHIDFQLEITIGLIAEFSSGKGRQEPHSTLGMLPLQMKINMKMSIRAQRRERDVNGTVLLDKERNCIWVLPLQCTLV